MPASFFTTWNRRFPTFGNLAFAAFLVAALSGIPLSFFFDPTQAADSVQMIHLSSPAAAFFRAVHYWSGQLFLVSTLLHVIEHLWQAGEKDVKAGKWLRLVLALILSVYVMLSGFILKWDAEGSMALQILDGLLETIPLFGTGIKQMLVGGAGNLFVLYVHHLVTATLIIAIIIFEHVRRAWPDRLSYVYVLGAGTALAVVAAPGLQPVAEGAVRGPWYFIGLQELLHWIPEPLVVVVITATALAALALTRWLNFRHARRTKIVLLVMLLAYVLLTANNWGLRDDNWNSLVF